jgi:hypothetical protein
MHPSAWNRGSRKLAPILRRMAFLCTGTESLLILRFPEHHPDPTILRAPLLQSQARRANGVDGLIGARDDRAAGGVRIFGSWLAETYVNANNRMRCGPATLLVLLGDRPQFTGGTYQDARGADGMRDNSTLVGADRAMGVSTPATTFLLCGIRGVYWTVALWTRASRCSSTRVRKES